MANHPAAPSRSGGLHCPPDVGPVHRITEEQLAAIRRYTSAEVVQMPNIPAKRLKALVSDGRVPQWRTGGTKGVWFTGRPEAEPTV